MCMSMSVAHLLSNHSKCVHLKQSKRGLPMQRCYTMCVWVNEKKETFCRRAANICHSTHTIPLNLVLRHTFQLDFKSPIIKYMQLFLKTSFARLSSATTLFFFLLLFFFSLFLLKIAFILWECVRAYVYVLGGSHFNDRTTNMLLIIFDSFVAATTAAVATPYFCVVWHYDSNVFG